MANQIAFINDTMQFNCQHDARWTPEGTLTIVDNGVYHDPPQATVVEYLLDETELIAELVWPYTPPFPVESNAHGSA